jgi:O-antigen/teichoic acid export membrane protein
MTVAQRVARNSLAQFGGRGITVLVSLGSLALLSRYLGAGYFGDYQLVLAFLLLANFSDLGISTVAVRRLAQDDHSPAELLANVLTLCIGLAILSAGIAVSATFILDYPGSVKGAMAVAALSLPIMVVGTTYSTIFAVNLRMEYASLASIAQAIVSLAAMVAVVLADRGVVWMFVAYNTGVVTYSVVCVFFARRFVRPGLAFDVALIRGMVVDVLPIAIGGGLTVAYDRIDIVLLQALTDDVEVGQYGLAYRLIDMAVPLSFFLVGSVYPLLAGYYADAAWDALRSLYQRCQDILCTAGVGVVIVAMLLAPVAVAIVGGSEFVPAVDSLRILSLAVFPIWLLVLAEHTLIAMGRQTALVWTAVGGLVLNVSLNLVLIPRLGQEGAAWATVLTECVVLAVTMAYFAKVLVWWPSFAVAARVVPVAGIAVLVAYVLPLHWAAEMGLAAALLVVAALLSRVATFDEIRDLLRQPGQDGSPFIGGEEPVATS